MFFFFKNLKMSAPGGTQTLSNFLPNFVRIEGTVNSSTLLIRQRNETDISRLSGDELLTRPGQKEPFEAVTYLFLSVIHLRRVSAQLSTAHSALLVTVHQMTVTSSANGEINGIRAALRPLSNSVVHPPVALF